MNVNSNETYVKHLQIDVHVLKISSNDRNNQKKTMNIIIERNMKYLN